MASANESIDPASAPGKGSPAQPAASEDGETLAAQRRDFYQRFVDVVDRDGRYPLDAYRFLQEALEFTVRRAHGAMADSPGAFAGECDSRHVGGVQLCLGLRDLAVERWGRMARGVLNSWGVRSTSDLGEMVFLMVRNEFLRKTDQDHREDFDNVFAFTELDALYELPRGPLVEPEFDYT